MTVYSNTDFPFCDSCEYWDEKTKGDKHGHSTGICRRYPPRANDMPIYTDSLEFCGEHNLFDEYLEDERAARDAEDGKAGDPK